MKTITERYTHKIKYTQYKIKKNKFKKIIWINISYPFSFVKDFCVMVNILILIPPGCSWGVSEMADMELAAAVWLMLQPERKKKRFSQKKDPTAEAHGIVLGDAVMGFEPRSLSRLRVNIASKRIFLCRIYPLFCHTHI